MTNSTFVIKLHILLPSSTYDCPYHVRARQDTINGKKRWARIRLEVSDRHEKTHRVESKAEKQSEKRGKKSISITTLQSTFVPVHAALLRWKVVAELLLPFFQLPSDTRNWAEVPFSLEFSTKTLRTLELSTSLFYLQRTPHLRELIVIIFN